MTSCARTDAEWIAALEDRDPFERALAALALCEQAPERAGVALPVLLESVDRVELGMSERCAAAIEALGPLLAGPLVAHLLENEWMTSERRAAVERALDRAGPYAVAPVLDALRGAGRARVDELGALLVAVGAPCVEPLARALAGEEDPALRGFAAWVLGRIGAPASPALPALRAALADPDRGVRETAAEAVARIEGAGVVGPR